MGAGLGEYLARALSNRAALTEPKDLAWLLASYARDGLARIEAAGGAPELANVRVALESALGIRFEGERGRRFFRSTLIQTLFYGIFSAWVLWTREQMARPEQGALFREAEQGPGLHAVSIIATGERERNWGFETPSGKMVDATADANLYRTTASSGH